LSVGRTCLCSARSLAEYTRQDIPRAVSIISGRHSGGKVFLLGHSLGGALVCAACAHCAALVAGVVPISGVYRFGSWWREHRQGGVVWSWVFLQLLRAVNASRRLTSFAGVTKRSMVPLQVWGATQKRHTRHVRARAPAVAAAHAIRARCHC
jgi:alpha-beta hydrolase superfamily lysophospholipase